MPFLLAAKVTKLLSHVTASGKQRNPVGVHASSSLELEGMLRVTQKRAVKYLALCFTAPLNGHCKAAADIGEDFISRATLLCVKLKLDKN